MSAATLSTFVGVYGLALWLGLYLIGRDPRNPQLLLAGLGLLAYALAVGGNLLVGLAPTESNLYTGRLSWPLLMVPRALLDRDLSLPPTGRNSGP